MTSHAATTSDVSTSGVSQKKPWYKVLYVQVLIAILVGAIFGWLEPTYATNDWIKALGEGFIKLIKMVIAPIIFCTVVSGIAHIQDAKKVGRIGIKALVYFEVVSTFALVIGLIVGNVVRPGAGFGGSMANAQAVAGYAKQAEAQKSVDFFLHIIPDTVVGAFAQGEILQVLLFSILFGFALMGLGERGHTLRAFIDDAAHGGFRRHRDCHESGPDRRVRRHGVHHRQVRHRSDSEPDRPDRDLLCHGRAVRVRGARYHRADGRVLDLQVPGLHQGRTVDRARHVILGKRASVA